MTRSFILAVLTALLLCLPSSAGTCTGSASCTACKNCHYCKYCTSGGTCGVCRTSSTGTQPVRTNTQAPARAPVQVTRCQAITKKGTQCKRSAQPGRSYCWQH